MASVGARLHKTGSVFSRIHDLVKCGIIPYDDRPLWYDVYKAFPPIREPKFVKDPDPDELGLVNVMDDVRPIFYPEDWAIATFKAVNQFPDRVPFSMMDDPKIKKETPLLHRFVKKYQDIQKDFPDSSKEDIFQKTLAQLNIKIHDY